MKALVADGYGPPKRLTVRDVPDPRPAAGEVLVRLAAAAVNPFDLKLVTGQLRGAMPLWPCSCTLMASTSSWTSCGKLVVTIG